jgi:CarD family transcriptional regulator
MSQSKIRAPRARPARTGFSERQQAAAPELLAPDEISSAAEAAPETRPEIVPGPQPEASLKPSARPEAELAEAGADAIKPTAQAEDGAHQAPVAVVRQPAEPDAPRDAPVQAAPPLAHPPETNEEPGDSDDERAGEVIPFRRPGEAEHVTLSEEKAAQFNQGDHVVYPTHGVGKVERIAIEEIAGHKLELIHITFEENRMTLRVPVTKARSAGLRKLATRTLFDEALGVLKGRARIKRTMWSRRAQEYEAKINSGDPMAIAEVVRDLHRNAGQPDQSFSERQIYEAAMDRLAAELAALDSTDKPTAAAKLADYLKTTIPDQAKTADG